MEWKASTFESLEPGDRIRVTSLSGNVYEATILTHGPAQAGLYVRRNGKIGRLLPERLDESSLERLGTAEPLARGDEVIVSPLGGEEHRGKLAGPPDERVDMKLGNGGTYSVPIARVAMQTVRVLFGSRDVRAGDEFLVRSRSGREIRGKALEVQPGTIVAELHPTRGRVRVAMDHLDMDTLYVLVPVPLAALGCSPAGA